MTNEIQISMRLPKDLLDRAKALVPVLAVDPAHAVWRISQAAVLRLALAEGLAVLETRYPVASRATRRRRPKR